MPTTERLRFLKCDLPEDSKFIISFKSLNLLSHYLLLSNSIELLPS